MEMAVLVLPDPFSSHGTEKKSKRQLFQTKGSGTPKSQKSHSELTYRSGIIQPWRFVK
jgi:hypothetical protein